MRVHHPVALADEGVVDATVDVNGASVPVADDGTFDVPDDATGWLDRWADGYGHDADELLADAVSETDTCQVEKNDGDVCGRDLPCPYHSED